MKHLRIIRTSAIDILLESCTVDMDELEQAHERAVPIDDVCTPSSSLHNRHTLVQSLGRDGQPSESPNSFHVESTSSSSSLSRSRRMEHVTRCHGDSSGLGSGLRL